MIQIEKVNKYFNRHKKNQIHVINDTTLTLGDSGLVALLGPSGSGKTTLLNAIGGLDRINKGKIFINGKRITRRSSNKIDDIRNLNIGYIFQDYHLIDNMSVFDNIALVLRMINIKSKEEIKKRVNYVLEMVGMYRYRNRLANMLSGGERQRVGIARAIVKNPSIIIADEPTGNLDSKNTLEVMNIIKAISKDKLVILVTHEKELAYFYSSRVIELQDGKIISDKENKDEGELDYRIDNKIYLKDIKHHTKLEKDNIKVNIYNEDKKNINLDIVIKNNNIYLKTENNEKLELVDETSSIEFVNDTYKKINKSEYENYKFDFDEIINNKAKQKYTSIFNPITLIINGFKKVLEYPFLKKMLLLGFLISGMFILYSISNIFGILDIKDEKFVKQNKNYLNIVMKNINVNDYLGYEKLESINYIIPGDSSVTFELKYEDFYQTTNVTDYLSGSLSSLSMINSNDIIIGSMPTNDKEIVIDKMTIDNMFESNNAKQAGIIKESDLIGREVSINNAGKYKIVGITSFSSPSVYASEMEFINILSNTAKNTEGYEYDTAIPTEGDSVSIINYELLKSEISLKKGSWPKNDYEVLINETNSETYKIGKTIDTKVNGKKLKVVGYYHDNRNRSFLLVNNNTVKYNLITNSENISVYSKNRNETINYFKDKKINIEDSYLKAKEEYKKSIKESVVITLVVAGVILSISLVEIFLMLRSSFLSRIKEVGIYRAIGLKKKDIYKMFLGEILAITTLASFPGYLLMYYIITKIMTLPLIKEQFVISVPVLVISILIIYGFNILVGLIPVFNTLRKSPATILSRTDI